MPNDYTNYYMRIGTEKAGMDDNGYSKKVVEKLDSDLSAKTVNKQLKAGAHNKSIDDKNINLFANLYHKNNIRRTRGEVYSSSKNGGPLFTQTYRFGLSNPYGAITSAREYIFFTKPDLHLYTSDYDSKTNTFTIKTKGKDKINKGLESYFWQDLFKNKDRIIRCLQASYGGIDLFNHLLQNTVNSNLELPTLNAPSIETSTNTYGVSLSYRGSSEESDDGPEFSLEFKDDKYLNVYSFFRAYEEYETLKKHGTIKPQPAYTMNKIIHDQFSIYKFIVDEDMETIIYWGKYYGVYPTSLPRDAFSNSNFQDGLTFSINFKAAFYEDMRPEILYDFNSVGAPLWAPEAKSGLHRIDVYNDVVGGIDGRTATVAYVEKVTSGPRAKNNPNGYYYRLAWKGDRVV